MKKSLIKSMIHGVAFVLLSLLSIDAVAQCNPVVVDRDGNKGKSATYCENELVSFEANSPGYTSTILWEFRHNNETSTQQNPQVAFQTAGSYTVKFTGTGGAGTCVDSMVLTIKRSPRINIKLTNSDIQCFEGNSFCFVDSSRAVPNSTIVRQTYVFSDGKRIDTLNPVFPIIFCCDFQDPAGGFYDMVIESEDANGCVSREVNADFFYVQPKLGVEFVNRTPPPNPGCDSTLGRYENTSLIDLSRISSFCWYWGDNSSLCGDSITNTEFWNGPDDDGIVEHMYNVGGVFDGKLVVTSDYGCTDSFVWKAAVTNIVLNPVILSDKDSSCTSDNPVAFYLKDGPPSNVSQFLWNFGDPPSGPLNTDDKNWDPTHSYGTGQWMISLRIVAGPCDVTVYDTIAKLGPGSTIEVPFDRVAEAEAYQCTITDTVRFPNNSSYYHNDPTQNDEDSVVFYYECTFEVVTSMATGQDSLRLTRWEEEKTGNKVRFRDNYPMNHTFTEKGETISYDSGKDSIKVVSGGVTKYYDKALYGINGKRRYVFNFTPLNGTGMGAGDQTAVDPTENIRGYDPNVWRVWDFGDRYAAQCTTDSRPWVNKNVGINCNWTIDSNPVHWYTPWDDIYRTFQDGQFYTDPYARTEIHKPTRQCYQINIFPANPMIVPGDTILTIPIDSSYTYRGVTIPAGMTYKNDTLGNWIVRRPPSCLYGTRVYYDASTDEWVAINNIDDTTRHSNYRVGRTSLPGGTDWTVTFHDMEFWIPSGVTVTMEKLAAPGGGGAGVGTSRTVTGPKLEVIEADEQIVIQAGDSIKSLITIEENGPDTTFATASNYIKDTVIFGIPQTVLASRIFVDSALHRTQFFLENGQCFQVELWQQDTIHPLMCESVGNKSLALIPPSAKGLEWTGGIPCPLDGDNLSYYLQFDMGETKPGCSQQYFAVNYDSLADPTAFVPFKSGGVLAPPPPGSPLPFTLPYNLVGSYGRQFIKGYTPGEIGNDPALRSPNGSFTLGLIIGNGPPTPSGAPALCLDTFWYGDMFRILYLNADFTIISPTNDPKAICAGGTAYFQIDEPIQDSIKTMRWAWGYQGLGRGPQLDIYVEQFEYYQPYNGPVAGRNDENINYNGEDWLYNYVIRNTITDLYGLTVIDTIVTSIIKEWQVVANTKNADDVIEDIFEDALGLYYQELDPACIPLYLGDGTFGCIDTTGLSQYFDFGIKAYSEKVDPLVFKDGDKRFRVDTSVMPHDTIEVAQILHFRDSSLRGYDSLEIDIDFDGNLDLVTGLWKKDYRYPVIVTPDPCYPNIKDTLSLPANGPMVPSLFLNNTVGCEKRGANLLNVGFLNDFWLDNENICNGLTVYLEDTLRYWQYGDMWPEDYPIDPRDFWHNPVRYSANIETFEVDWDKSDGLGPIWERSLVLNHIYDEPGEYIVTVVSKDSIGCRDTVEVTAYITDVIPDFTLSNGFLNCATFVDFLDSSQVIDPCALKDTCTTGVDLSCEKIVAWRWDFGDGTRQSILQNPSHDYTRGGWFDVKLTVWTELGCVDSITKRIFIPGPQPEFEFENAIWNLNDTARICVNDSVNLLNISGGEKIDPTWEMVWGDGFKDNPGDSGTYFGHRYTAEGVYELYLTQFDEIPPTNIRCSRIFPDTNPDLSDLRKIVVIVAPRAKADMSISDTIICPDELTTLTAHVDTLYTRYQWDFGDGDTASRFYPDSTIDKSYDTPGIYNVKLIPDYTPPQFQPKCVDTAYGRIEVVEVIANFDIDDSEAPNFCFTNTSTGASSYNWTFEDDPVDVTSTDVDPCHNWDDRRGTWIICLEAISAEGCKDIHCDTIENNYFIELIPYNVFTPPATNSGGDGLNDEFVIDGEGLDLYNIKIYNRWGEQVFESDDIETSWNGQVNNTGVECPDGTYFWIINYQFEFDELNQGGEPIEGTVTLTREQN